MVQASIGVFYSHYLPRNGQFTHYKSTFTPAHDWEKTVIWLEGGTALIRQLNDQLMQMRRLSRSSQRLLGSLILHLDEMEVSGMTHDLGANRLQKTTAVAHHAT